MVAAHGGQSGHASRRAPRSLRLSGYVNGIHVHHDARHALADVHVHSMTCMCCNRMRVINLHVHIMHMMYMYADVLYACVRTQLQYADVLYADVPACYI